MSEPTGDPAGPLRIAVLASGRGSNLQALIDAIRGDRLGARLVVVAGDRADAEALRRAERAGVATVALEPRAYASRRDFDEDLFRRVAAFEPALVVLAGFMRILDATVLVPWSGRIINIHPSLLPRHRGLHTHRRALAAGDAVHGASVHYVTAGLDEGPTLAQAVVPVSGSDTTESLAARVLAREHRLLVAAVALVAAGRVRLDATGIVLDGYVLDRPLRLLDDDSLASG